jgi:hypothetical protein
LRFSRETPNKTGGFEAEVINSAGAAFKSIVGTNSRRLRRLKGMAPRNFGLRRARFC